MYVRGFRLGRECPCYGALRVLPPLVHGLTPLLSFIAKPGLVHGHCRSSLSREKVLTSDRSLLSTILLLLLAVITPARSNECDRWLCLRKAYDPQPPAV